MRRVFTDERFPGFQIVNDGSGTFHVYEGDQLIHDFESWENPDGTVSEEFASRRAADYFEHWSKMDLSGEFEKEMNAQAPEAMDTMERKPLGSQIDTLMARENVEADPQKKQALRQQIMALMRQEESLAESVVNHLLGL